MTDERLGEALWEAVDRLPEGAGIVLRHYSLDASARAALAGAIADQVHSRGIMLAVAGDASLARRIGATLVHNPGGDTRGLPFSRSVHNLHEAAAARADGAALIFVSPVHPTRSHPDAEPLGPEQAISIAKAAGVPAIALGGVNEKNFGALERGAFYGWAGIDAWLGVRT
jgi:thiamine-phosphate pyrophosphorylase